MKRALVLQFAALSAVAFASSAYSATPNKADVAPSIISVLADGRVHAEWIKHRNWFRDSTSMEDYDHREANISINRDGTFSGTLQESVGKWSQIIQVTGDFNKGTYQTQMVSGSVLVQGNSISFIWVIGKAIERYVITIEKNKGKIECSIDDKFLKQAGAPVQFEYNGSIEHHDGPEPITWSECSISPS